MFKGILSLFKGKKESLEKLEEEKVEEKNISEQASRETSREEEENKGVREITPQELELFKKAMGITPYNYWQWAGRTNNFKLLTDGKWIWVEGYEEHIGKQLPLTQAGAWSWEFIKS